MRELFGTDGIRARANAEALAPESILRIGRILAAVLRERASGGGPPPRVAIARDTRRSGPMIRDALAAGLLGGGADVLDAGVFTTPGLATILPRTGACLGAIVSASHNPAEDNGLKLLGPDGEKLPVEIEGEVERRFAGEPLERIEGGPVGRSSPVPGPDRLYREALAAGRFPALDLRGLAIALDSANGAAFTLGPRVLKSFGARVVRVACRPDGDNVNERCGSLHPEKVAKAVSRRGAAIGVALDGDGDRAILADASGTVHDGDSVLWMMARAMKSGAVARTLRGDVVVGTVMSNGGLEAALAGIGVRLHRAPVGDRNVLAAMRETGAVLGGEPSGHVIFDDGGPLIGDGLVTALKAGELLVASGQGFDRLASGFSRFAQVILNVRVTSRPSVDDVPALRTGVAEARDSLGPGSRVLLRYSGTEPLLRVMVEGREADAVTAAARRLADAARENLSG